ncbi:MAG: hypothetical protein ACYS26_01275 [Planctomycetota bacterium]|jgi:hypothetical protein
MHLPLSSKRSNDSLSATGLGLICVAALCASPAAAQQRIAPTWAHPIDLSIVQEDEVEQPQETAQEDESMLDKGLEAGKDAGEAVVETGKDILSLPGKAFSAFSSDELPDLSAGRQELGLSGNINFSDDVAYNIDLSYGYFFKDNWELGFTANSFGRDDFNLGIGLFTEYNWTFEDSKWVPYVGGAVKWARVSTDDVSENSVAFTGELGVKYFIRSDVSLFSSFNFDWSPDDVFGIGDEIEDSAQNINFGLRFYL